MRRILKSLSYMMLVLGISGDILYSDNSKELIQNRLHLSLASWELDLDRLNHENDGMLIKSELKQSSLTAAIVQEVPLELNEIITEIANRESLATEIQNRFAYEKSRMISMLSEGITNRENKRNDSIPVPDHSRFLLFSSSNLIIQVNKFFPHFYVKVLEIRPTIIIKSITTATSSLFVLSKKQMKYYSIRKKAPPVGEIKC